MVHWMYGNMNMNMEMNRDMKYVCILILFEYYMGKWKSKVLKPLAINSTNTTNY